MRDYRHIVENALFNLENEISDFWLYEGVNEFAKQFPKMSLDHLKKLLTLDPTYKGGDQVGKYGNWIIRLFYNNLKNDERIADYKEFYAKNNGINPKTGKMIEKPELLPATKWEDAEKIPPLLKQYEALKGKIKKPITAFPDIPSLYNEIESLKGSGVPTDKKALERYNVFKSSEEKGLKKIYEDKDWIIGIPTTLESSVPFGEFTNWCTTSAHGRYYEQYLRDYGGEYYILLNKNDGALFQFHFESMQFMDENDRQIDMYNFTKAFPKIAKVLFNYKNENSKTPANQLFEDKEKFEEIYKNPEKIQKEILWTNYTKNVKVEGDKVSGTFDLDSLDNYIYDQRTYSSSSGLSLKSVCSLLTEFYDNMDFWGDYRLSDYDYQGSDWNNIAKKYNLPLMWDDICSIYKNDDEEYIDDIPNYEKVQEIIQDDFFDGVGLLAFCNTCTEYGTESECHNDIMDELSDNLPVSRNSSVMLGLKGAVEIDFELSKKDLWGIWYIMKYKNDNIPELGANRQRELELDKSSIKRTMSDDWFEDWKNTEADDYDEEYQNWIYLWRVLKGKCELDDGDYGAFVIDEPSYGWSGFDEKYFEDGCETAAKKIAEIIKREE